LDELSFEAEQIGAVNTISVTLQDNKPYFKGYNTDKPAFEKTISPFLRDIKGAIVLGTGGASKAIVASLKDCNIPFIVVGRTSKIQYRHLTKAMLETHNVIINCTPIGTFPASDAYPLIPYDCLNDKNILYDLVYNPAETLFMNKGKKRNATVYNGLKMLEVQAELAFEIWKNQ
jgi:shikimate dehydrogenase